jgi:hypothetical protein
MVIKIKRLQRKFTRSQETFLACLTRIPWTYGGLNVSEKEGVNQYSPGSLLFMDAKRKSDNNLEIGNGRVDEDSSKISQNGPLASEA